MSIILPITRASLGESCKAIATELDPALIQRHGERVGYAVVLFPLGALTDFAWVSDVQTDGLIKVLQEVIKSLQTRGMAGGLIT